jgi:hypothetical protein
MDNREVHLKSFDRAVIGGGLFGAYASLVLAKRGFNVCIIEQGHQFLGRASFVNQARLHSGLHYPRSLQTAIEARLHYEKFRSQYPSAVRDFQHIYAISRYNSKTSEQDFRLFIQRLGMDLQECAPNSYFNTSTTSSAFQVEEPSFDAVELRKIFTKEIEDSPNITVLLNSKVTGGALDNKGSEIILSNGSKISAKGLVITAYAGINGIRKALGLELLPLVFELADIFIVEVPKAIENLGFTIMDGPFWSLMPFGNTRFSSLTSVGLTPIDKSDELPIFECQSHRKDCSPLGLADCSMCDFRPKSNFDHILQQVSLHLKYSKEIKKIDRLTTVKAILNNSQVDDSRPTVIRKENFAEVSTIFSGKITTLFDIERDLH